MKKLKSFITQNNLINSKTVGVAVSGGPDSVFMLYTLNEIKKDLGFDITVLHFNHKIRKKAEQDAFFVQNLSETMGLKYTIDSYDVPKFAKDNRLSLEDAARIKRYEFLKRCKQQLNLGEIALAHTKDDLVETFIMNMLRGASLSGLTSMRVKRDFYIRPVMFIEKNEILKYLKEEKIDFRIDESNKDVSFLRNKIRLELLDILKKYNPNITETIWKEADILLQEDRYLDKLTQKATLSCVKFIKNRAIIDTTNLKDLAIKRRVISAVCKKIIKTDYSLSFNNINRIALLENENKTVVLRKLIKAYLKNGKLTIEAL